MIDSSAGGDADTPPPGLSLDSYLAVVHRYRWLILMARWEALSRASSSR